MLLPKLFQSHSASLLTPALHFTLDLHIASDVPFCICNHVDMFSFEVKLGAPNPCLSPLVLAVDKSVAIFLQRIF